MLKKNNRSLQVDVQGSTLEKSLSSPELSKVVRDISKSNTDQNINERSKEKNDQKGLNKKDGKISWFRRLLNRFDRKKRRKTEPVLHSESFQVVQQLNTSQFYAPPPQDFLNAVTNREDEVDNQIQASTVKPTNEYDAVAEEDIRGPSLQAGPSNPIVIHELKKMLSVKSQSEGARAEDDQPEYGNVSNLKYPASRRRQSRAPSADSAVLEQHLREINELYEPTWKYTSKEPKPKPPLNTSFKHKEIERMDSVHPPSVAPQPIKPLLAFPKPKPPINRKPSSRRGSKPEVHIRKSSLEVNQEASTQNRRSIAELEMVISKLNEIPTPDHKPLTPQPKKRTKFFSYPSQSPKDDIIIQEQVSLLENGTLAEKERNILSTTTDETDLHSSDMLIELEAEINELESKQMEINPKAPSLTANKTVPIKRTNSFPCIKFSLKNLDDKKVLVVETVKDSSEGIAQTTSTETPFKRWKTLPTQYHRDSSKFLRQAEENSAILVVNNTEELLGSNLEDVTQLAIVLRSDSRPLTQDNSTQTSLKQSEVTHIQVTTYENKTNNILDHSTQEYTEVVDLGERELSNQYTPPNTPENNIENYESEDLMASYYHKRYENSRILHSNTKSAKDILSETSTSLKSSEENINEGLVHLQPNTQETRLGEHKEETLTNESETEDDFHSKKAPSEMEPNKNKDDQISTHNDILPQQLLREIASSKIRNNSKQQGTSPVKPSRIKKIHPKSQKPSILPKPQYFIRQEALRSERHSISEDFKMKLHGFQGDDVSVEQQTVEPYQRYGLYQIHAKKANEETNKEIQKQRNRSQSLV